MENLLIQKEYCENAYFKMDNVLIDDRRIHVDFSQSVAKVKWKGKGTYKQTHIVYSCNYFCQRILAIFCNSFYLYYFQSTNLMLVGKGVQTFEKKEKADTKSTAYTGGIYGLNHDDNFASKTHSKVLSSSSRSLCFK